MRMCMAFFDVFNTYMFGAFRELVKKKETQVMMDNVTFLPPGCNHVNVARVLNWQRKNSYEKLM